MIYKEYAKLKSAIISREGINEDCTYEKKQLADTLKALGEKEPKKESKKQSKQGRVIEEDTLKDEIDPEKIITEPKKSRFF